jgi:hypothetical protein
MAGMRFRKLRIAWSVGWGLLGVLLIVLWVRSYYSTVFVVGPLTDPYGSLLIETRQGRVTLCLSYGSGVVGGRNASPWGMHFKPLEEWEQVNPPLNARPVFSYVRWNVNHQLPNIALLVSHASLRLSRISTVAFALVQALQPPHSANPHDASGGGAGIDHIRGAVEWRAWTNTGTTSGGTWRFLRLFGRSLCAFCSVACFTTAGRER